MEYTENERLFLTISGLQNTTDDGLLKPMPIWDKYLNIIFANISNATHDLHLRKILTSKTGVYYFRTLFQYIETLPEAELELFIWWSVVEQIMMHTTSDIRYMHDRYFYEGHEADRDVYCSFYVNEFMGIAISHALIEPGFSIDNKSTVNNMLRNIRKEFAKAVRKTPWMENKSKHLTLEKSAAMKNFTGYPEWILNETLVNQYYSGMQFKENTHFANMIHVLQLLMSNYLDGMHQSDPLEYEMPVTAVNLFYSSKHNTISKFPLLWFKVDVSIYS